MRDVFLIIAIRSSTTIHVVEKIKAHRLSLDGLAASTAEFGGSIRRHYGSLRSTSLATSLRRIAGGTAPRCSTTLQKPKSDKLAIPVVDRSHRLWAHPYALLSLSLSFRKETLGLFGSFPSNSIRLPLHNRCMQFFISERRNCHNAKSSASCSCRSWMFPSYFIRPCKPLEVRILYFRRNALP